MPPEFWTPEQLREAAIGEAIKHGADKAYLDSLKRQLAESNKLQLADIEIPEDKAP